MTGSSAKALRCRSCGKTSELKNMNTCESCGGILDVEYDYRSLNKETFFQPHTSTLGAQWHWRSLLPVLEEKNIVSLGEGGTPLIKADRLAGTLGLPCSLYLKLEGNNPTASFKDRPVSTAVSKAKELGASVVVVASTGNTAASAAAYAARGNMECVVLIPQHTSAEKVRLAIYAGARVFTVVGTFSDAYHLAKEASKKFGWPNITTTYINPYTLEGDKTIAYEINSQLGGGVPDAIVVPIGAGPLLTAMYKGYSELRELGVINTLPCLIGVQSNNCSPIVRAFKEGLEYVKGWTQDSSTVASAIADPLIGYEEDGALTLRIIRAVGGMAVGLDEHDIEEATTMLSEVEGVFAEPASATTVGVLKKCMSFGMELDRKTVVCLITGHGLKAKLPLSYEPVTVCDLEDIQHALKGLI